MTDRHISDDRLIEICLTPTPSPLEQGHLAACARCDARRVEIVGILADLDAAATQEAGVAFPDARLERQHARILQRVDEDGRPGRVVAFPAQRPAPTTFLMPSRPRMRWAAAMAAAAFVAGVVTGQWTHKFTDNTGAVPMQIIANDTDQSLRAVPTTFSEEEFLWQLEMAASRNGPEVLRPLDAMTPRAWDVR